MAWEGYKRGVPWVEVLCHAHKHGSQIQTLKKKRYIRSVQHTYIVYQMTIKHVPVMHVCYFNGHFCAEMCEWCNLYVKAV